MKVGITRKEKENPNQDLIDLSYELDFYKKAFLSAKKFIEAHPVDHDINEVAENAFIEYKNSRNELEKYLNEQN